MRFLFFLLPFTVIAQPDSATYYNNIQSLKSLPNFAGLSYEVNELPKGESMEGWIYKLKFTSADSVVRYGEKFKDEIEFLTNVTLGVGLDTVTYFDAEHELICKINFNRPYAGKDSVIVSSYKKGFKYSEIKYLLRDVDIKYRANAFYLPLPDPKKQIHHYREKLYTADPKKFFVNEWVNGKLKEKKLKR